MESRFIAQWQMLTYFFDVNKFKLSLYRNHRQCSVCKITVLQIRKFLYDSSNILTQIPAKSRFIS